MAWAQAQKACRVENLSASAWSLIVSSLTGAAPPYGWKGPNLLAPRLVHFGAGLSTQTKVMNYLFKMLRVFGVLCRSLVGCADRL